MVQSRKSEQKAGVGCPLPALQRASMIGFDPFSGPLCFTLSYTRFLFLPDVFRSEFVIIYSWAHSSRGKTR